MLFLCRVIEDVDDIEDFRKIKDEDKEVIKKLLKEFQKFRDSKGSTSSSSTTPKKTTPKKASTSSSVSGKLKEIHSYKFKY